MYWLLIIFYAILIYLSIILVCIVVYSSFIVLMLIGFHINKQLMCCFECWMEFLFNPVSCIVETCLHCYHSCNRVPESNPRVETTPKEIEMVVIVNPGEIPLQIGIESV